MKMRPLRTAAYGAALVSTNLKEAFAHRGAFWLQLAFMFANNVVFFTTWWIFFARFEEVRGWRVNDMLALYGVVALGYGLSVVFAGGIRDLARSIVEGQLDVYLTRPKSTLVQVGASRTHASGWGDMITSLLFLGLSGYVTWEKLPLVAVGAFCSATVLTATSVIAHSLAFWLGHIHALARMFTEFLVFFSIYPEALFTGGLRVLLFTAIPAGFIGFLPAAQIRGAGPEMLLILMAATVAYALLAAGVFALGLRRYSSGSRFQVQA